MTSAKIALLCSCHARPISSSASKEPINLCSEGIHRFLSCTIIRAILDHWVQPTLWKFVPQTFHFCSEVDHLLLWSNTGYTRSWHKKTILRCLFKTHRKNALAQNVHYETSCALLPFPSPPANATFTLLSRATWLGAFALCSAKTAVVSSQEKLTKVRNNS